MKRKGFTLIELLAVIVILAVIALIATPIIMNYSEDARDGALKASARNIIDAGEKLYAKKLLENPNVTPVISFDELEYQGEQLEKGTIEFDEQGLASIAIFHQNKCIYKNPTDKDVILDKTLDETECLQKLGEIIIQGVTLDKTSLTMSVGGSEILKATIIPETTTQDTTLTWESSHPDVATVTNGVVEALSSGTTIITVKTKNGKTATCTVTVKNPTGVELLLSKANGSNVTNYTSGNTGEMYTFTYPATSQTGALTDYRYIGNVPNNYITFNNETWRIIGVIEGRIKIVKDTSIGNLSWDYKQNGVGSSSSRDGSSDWTDSQLMYMLNPTTFTLKSDYTNDGTYIRDANNKIVYQLGCNPASTDGSSYSCTQNSWSLNETALSQVDTAIWYLGGDSEREGHSAETYYAFERGTTVYSGRPTNWQGKVGLMYPSDYAYTYAYGVDNTCYTDTYNCLSGNPASGWLHNNDYQWLISPFSNSVHHAYVVMNNGRIISNAAVAVTSAHNGIRPVTYLRSDIELTGTGTTTDPYKIVG